jgi:AAA15 family ATPase/GTPase
MKQVFKVIGTLGALASVGNFILNFNKDWTLKVSVEPKENNRNNSSLAKEKDGSNCPIFYKSTRGCD